MTKRTSRRTRESRSWASAQPHIPELDVRFSAAKRVGTRERRIRDSVALLAAGDRLGMR